MDRINFLDSFNEQKIRRVFIILILISLFFPFSNVNGYFPIFLYIIFTIIESFIVHPVGLNFSGLLESIESLWFLIFIVSLWAGPILAISNRVILNGRKKIWLYIIRILIPLFLISLVFWGILIFCIGGLGHGYGYWGYVFVIFLGGIIEVYSYLREKREKVL